MSEPRFYNVKDITGIMGISESKAYTLIRQLNAELKEKGYITIAGKIPRVYFEERTYFNKKEVK